jgi:predicted nicotinamide N-methyase
MEGAAGGRLCGLTTKVHSAVLQDEPTWIKDKRVLELGAGVGYVGLKAATLGA